MIYFNTMIYLILLLIVFFTVLFVLIGLSSFYYRTPNIRYALACAGTEHKDNPELKNVFEDYGKSIYTNSFFEHDGKTEVNVSLYNHFIVKGNSMQISGIVDGDLVMSRKDFKIKDFEFPCICVLKRDRSEKEKIEFKLRRGWRIIDLNDFKDNIKNEFISLLGSILSDKGFIKLRNSSAFTSDDNMIEDFFINRLLPFYNKYSDDSPINISKDRLDDCIRLINIDKIPSEMRKILISTTLHTNDNEILFSIHPITNIVGKVDFCYDISQKEDVA